MSFKKIDKEFCITDNSVNCYGYRLLTEGFQIESFNPPIGYLMHDRDKGVAVRWSDFRVDGDKVFAKPTVNALQFPNLASEIEAGFYNAASVGHIIALEWTDDAAQKMPGQTGITVTKWFCRECSIVDVPGNFNAIADLYDKDEKSLKNLISKPVQPTDQKGEEVPEQYRKSFTELFISGELELVAKNYPKFYENLISGNDKDKALDMPSVIPPQVNNKEVPIPERYIGRSYTDLYMSGDMEYLKKNHPLYVKLLQEESKAKYEAERNRGVAKDKDAVKRTPSDTSLPEQYRDKTKLELFYNGGLGYLKAHHPNIFNDLVSN